MNDSKPAHDCLREMPLLAMDVIASTFGRCQQCAALNLTNVNVQRLTVEAAITGNPEAVVWALALDPLTSAKLTLAEIREMATEMLIAEAEWLPQFKGRLPRSTPKVVEPAGTVRVDVPMDPALAIRVRFGQL